MGSITNLGAEFVDSANRQLDKLEQSIRRIEEGLEIRTDQARARARVGVARLRSQQQDVRAALVRARNATTDQWAEAKEAVSRGLARLEEGYNGLIEEMKIDHE